MLGKQGRERPAQDGAVADAPVADLVEPGLLGDLEQVAGVVGRADVLEQVGRGLVGVGLALAREAVGLREGVVDDAQVGVGDTGFAQAPVVPFPGLAPALDVWYRGSDWKMKSNDVSSTRVLKESFPSIESVTYRHAGPSL